MSMSLYRLRRQLIESYEQQCPQSAGNLFLQFLREASIHQIMGEDRLIL
jgi:hypothetical protein